jgi:hypothetical protein
MSEYTYYPAQTQILREWEKKVSEHLKIGECSLLEYGSPGKVTFDTIICKHTSSVGITLQFIPDSDLRPIANFKLLQMPGCCGMCISTGSIITSNYRNKGLNNILNKFRIELATMCRYSVLVCTDRSLNTPNSKTLIKNGWKKLFSFVNKRTNASVDLSVIELKP